MYLVINKERCMNSVYRRPRLGLLFMCFYNNSEEINYNIKFDEVFFPLANNNNINYKTIEFEHETPFQLNLKLI